MPCPSPIQYSVPNNAVLSVSCTHIHYSVVYLIHDGPIPSTLHSSDSFLKYPVPWAIHSPGSQVHVYSSISYQCILYSSSRCVSHSPVLIPCTLHSRTTSLIYPVLWYLIYHQVTNAPQVQPVSAINVFCVPLLSSIYSLPNPPVQPGYPLLHYNGMCCQCVSYSPHRVHLVL